jgi:hypothetical protein
MAITGPHLVSVYDANVASCHANRGPSANCVNGVVNTDHSLQVGLQFILMVLPALLGIFWGAPLVARELETGTFRLGWTQSVTRRRWLATKVGVVSLATVVATGLLSLMVTWWFSPIDTATAQRFGTFDVRDITPIGYVAFAFALGVTVGVLMRRTVPAMATTLAGFVAARLAVTYWVRPHLLSPAHTTMALTLGEVSVDKTPMGLQLVANGVTIPNAWVYSSSIVNASGQSPSDRFLAKACPNLGVSSGGSSGVLPIHKIQGGHAPAPAGIQNCIDNVAAKFHLLVTYQPPSRYWALQGLETAVFLAAAVLLVVLCFWWVRRRLA